SRYRPSEEEQEWAEKDPILRLRRHLEQLDEIDEDFIARCDEEGHDLAMQLHHHIHGMEDPDPDGMFEHVYSEPHPIVAADREDYRNYIAQFDDPTDQEAARCAPPPCRSPRPSPPACAMPCAPTTAG